MGDAVVFVVLSGWMFLQMSPQRLDMKWQWWIFKDKQKQIFASWCHEIVDGEVSGSWNAPQPGHGHHLMIFPSEKLGQHWTRAKAHRALASRAKCSAQMFFFLCFFL